MSSPDCSVNQGNTVTNLCKAQLFDGKGKESIAVESGGLNVFTAGSRCPEANRSHPSSLVFESLKHLYCLLSRNQKDWGLRRYLRHRYPRIAGGSNISLGGVEHALKLFCGQACCDHSQRLSIQWGSRRA